MLSRCNFEVVRSAEDLSRLLQGILNFAGREQGCGSRVLILVFAIFVDEAEFMEIADGGIERSNRAMEWSGHEFEGGSPTNTYSCRAVLTSLIHCTPESL
jgi:hypothetical protein